MTDLKALTAANAKRWKAAKPTRDFALVAKRLATARSRYKAVAARTGVPWFVIAVIHERECSQSWTGSLAQGDPWNKVSVHVPAGRGPFPSWEEAAVDALINCAPHAARWSDWSVGALWPCSSSITASAMPTVACRLLTSGRAPTNIGPANMFVTASTIRPQSTVSWAARAC